MGLTKAQIAERKAAAAKQLKLDQLAAFRLTEECKPDVPPPSGGYQDISRGWAYNSYSKTIRESWSTYMTHGDFYNGERISGSQGSRWLYSSRERALKAMRHEVELQAAADLHKIDQLIKGASL